MRCGPDEMTDGMIHEPDAVTAGELRDIFSRVNPEMFKDATVWWGHTLEKSPEAVVLCLKPKLAPRWLKWPVGSRALYVEPAPAVPNHPETFVVESLACDETAALPWLLVPAWLAGQVPPSQALTLYHRAGDSPSGQPHDIHYAIARKACFDLIERPGTLSRLWTAVREMSKADPRFGNGPSLDWLGQPTESAF